MNAESNQNHRIFNLQFFIIFLIIVLLLLGSYTQNKYYEIKALKDSFFILEASLTDQKTKVKSQLDSLQRIIQNQEKLQIELRDSVAHLKNKRIDIKATTNENKVAIQRISDIDSLRNEIARHYH